MKYRIKNTRPSQQQEVRIYRVSNTGSIDFGEDGFTNLDDMGTAVGVRLSEGYDVNCDGALNTATVDTEITGEVVILDKDNNRFAVSNNAELISTLDLHFGIEAHVLTPYVAE